MAVNIIINNNEDTEASLSLYKQFVAIPPAFVDATVVITQTLENTFGVSFTLIDDNSDSGYLTITSPSDIFIEGKTFLFIESGSGVMTRVMPISVSPTQLETIVGGSFATDPQTRLLHIRVYN